MQFFIFVAQGHIISLIACKSF